MRLCLFFKTKRGLGSVVVTSILLVMTVFIVVSFQSWYQTYSSELFLESEIKSDSSLNNLKLDALVGNQLYILNNVQDNYIITEIKVGSQSCFYEVNLSLGINELDVGYCLLRNMQINDESSVEVLLISDDLVISKEFSSKEEIDFDFESLLGYWSFDGDENYRLLDSSKNNREGEIVRYIGREYNSSKFESGPFGNSISFFPDLPEHTKNGTRFFVEENNSCVFGNLNCWNKTINFWVKPTGYIGPVIMATDYENPSGTNGNGWSLRYHGHTSSDKTLNFRYFNTTGSIDTTFNFLKSKDILENGVWSMVTLAIDSNWIKLYVNSELSNFTQNTGFNFTDITKKNLVIGGSTSVQHYSFNGSIDEVMVFNKSLSEAEIKFLYNLH